MQKQHIINAHKKKFMKLETYKQVTLLYDPFRTLYEWKNPNVVEFDNRFDTNLPSHTRAGFTSLSYQSLSPATTMTFSSKCRENKYIQKIKTKDLPRHTFGAELYQ